MALLACVAGASLAARPPSWAPPSSSRVAVGSAVSGEPAADGNIVLTNGDDSVLVWPEVEPYTLNYFSQVNGPGHEGFDLLDGGKLYITDTTSEGRYALANGDSVFLQSEQKFPRYYTFQPRAQRTCGFRVRSSRGIAVLVQRGPLASADSLRVAELMSQPGSLPTTNDGLHLRANADAQLVLVPGSWYLTARIALPDSWDGMKLTFFAYGPESPERPRRSFGPVHHLGPAHVPSKLYGPTDEEALLRRPPDEVLASATRLRGNISLSANPEE